MYLIKYTQEKCEKSSIKVSAYLSPKNEWVKKNNTSLCTKSRDLIAHKALSMGKVTWYGLTITQPWQTPLVHKTLGRKSAKFYVLNWYKYL
jgi:hypothetical protein